MHKYISFLIICLFFVLSRPLILAQSIIDLAKTTDLDVSQNRLYYEDKTGKLSLQQIQSPLFDKQFKSSDKENLNFGFTSSTIWLKIKLKSSKLGNDDYLALVNYATLDVVEFYFWQATKQNYLSYYSGDTKAFVERKIQNRKFLMPLHFADTTTHTLYIKVSNQTTLQVPFSIIKKSDYDLISARNEIGFGIFYGILFIMFFYNLFIFISLRDINYLYYIFTILGSLLTFASLAGHQSQYLFPYTPLFANQCLALGSAMLMTGSLLFTIHFLQVKKYNLWLNYLLWSFVLVGFLLILLSLVLTNLYGKLVFLSNILGILVGLIVLFSSIYCFKKGNKAARFFILAFSFYIIGIIGLVMRNLGFLPINLFTLNTGEIGAILEVLFLSLALGDRYNLYRQEKEMAQKEMLAMQQAANVTLEKKVVERTLQLQDANATLNAQNNELITLNEEISQQNEEIVSQRDTLSQAFGEIHRQKENIIASINYAKKIQTAMLPFEEKIAESLAHFFIFYQPRDIVSGDFYFFEDKETHLIFSALDCTGHGVPGAFMSMIGHEILSEIVNVKNIYSPDLILDELHKSIRIALQQEKSDNHDGMDVVMVSLKKGLSKTESKTKTYFAYLDYAGAMNPFYYVQNNVLHEIKATKKAIGGYQEETTRNFEKHRIELANQKTVFWLCSDGYQDQFGGNHNRKFMVKRFRELLFSIRTLSMQEQKNILATTFETWKSDREQVDDILIIGVEI